MERDPSGWVSIARAAAATGVSRRTVERWIKHGRLDSTPSPVDRRQRLVRLTDVYSAAGQTPPDVNGRAERAAPESPGQRQAEIQADEFRDVIDQTLVMASRYHQRLGSELFAADSRPPTLEQLRQGRLGQILESLARAARGQPDAPPKRIAHSADGLLQFLFWPMAAERFTVPWPFWRTPLGRLVSLAQMRTVNPAELLDVIEAAKELGITPKLLSSMMEAGEVRYVFDPNADRPFVVRESLAFWNQPAPIGTELWDVAKDVIRRTGMDVRAREAYQSWERIANQTKTVFPDVEKDPMFWFLREPDISWQARVVLRFLDGTPEDPPTRQDWLRFRQLLDDPKADPDGDQDEEDEEGE